MDKINNDTNTFKALRLEDQFTLKAPQFEHNNLMQWGAEVLSTEQKNHRAEFAGIEDLKEVIEDLAEQVNTDQPGADNIDSLKQAIEDLVNRINAGESGGGQSPGDSPETGETDNPGGTTDPDGTPEPPETGETDNPGGTTDPGGTPETGEPTAQELADSTNTVADPSTSWQDVLALTENRHFANDNTFALAVLTRTPASREMGATDEEVALYQKAIDNLQAANNDLVFDEQGRLDIGSTDESVFTEAQQRAGELGLDTVALHASYLIAHKSPMDLSGIDDDTVSEVLLDTLLASGLEEDDARAALVSIAPHLSNDSLHAQEALFLADHISEITGLDGHSIMADTVNSLYNLIELENLLNGNVPVSRNDQGAEPATRALAMTATAERPIADLLEAATDTGPGGSVPSAEGLDALVEQYAAEAEAELEASGELATIQAEAEQAALNIIERELAVSEVAEAEAAFEAFAVLGPVALGALAAGAVGYAIYKGVEALRQHHDTSAVEPFAERFKDDLSRASEIVLNASQGDRMPSQNEIAELNEIMTRVRSDVGDLKQALEDHPHASDILKNQAAAADALVDNLYEQALAGPLGLTLAPLDGGLTPAQAASQHLQEQIFNDPTLNGDLLAENFAIEQQLVEGPAGKFGTEFELTVAAGTVLTQQQIDALLTHAANAAAHGQATAQDLTGVDFGTPPGLVVRAPDQSILYDTYTDLSVQTQLDLQQLFDNNNLNANITRNDSDQMVISVKDRANIPVNPVFAEALEARLAEKLGHHNFVLDVLSDPNVALPTEDTLYTFDSSGILLGGNTPESRLDGIFHGTRPRERPPLLAELSLEKPEDREVIRLMNEAQLKDWAESLGSTGRQMELAFASNDPAMSDAVFALSLKVTELDHVPKGGGVGTPGFTQENVVNAEGLTPAQVRQHITDTILGQAGNDVRTDLRGDDTAAQEAALDRAIDMIKQINFAGAPADEIHAIGLGNDVLATSWVDGKRSAAAYNQLAPELDTIAREIGSEISDGNATERAKAGRERIVEIVRAYVNGENPALSQAEEAFGPKLREFAAIQLAELAREDVRAREAGIDNLGIVEAALDNLIDNSFSKVYSSGQSKNLAPFAIKGGQDALREIYEEAADDQAEATN